MLGRSLDKAADLTAAGKMLALGTQHDNPHAIVGIERLERGAQLLALRHREDVERRPVEHDVGALAPGINHQPETGEAFGQ